MFRPKRIEPGPGQESVWDYPRPARIEPCRRLVTVKFAGRQVARSDRALRGCWRPPAPRPSTSPPPISTSNACGPPAVGEGCEWKGAAAYFDLVAGEQRSPRAAWTYPKPTPSFSELADHFSFYPARTDGCYLDEELVEPQPGGFYGGWVTADIVGPINGEPGSLLW